ncbi:jg10224 [Pararge aegeria aegeria]|uniref:Jg10224 protein n=1 Tax=Pararge aegeria aegeria TaxID=348720 RepID=A0A8S4SN26_9NEOP|nr:jg10224 [Pararge aegeria aegeria]
MKMLRGAADVTRLDKVRNEYIKKRTPCFHVVTTVVKDIKNSNLNFVTTQDSRVDKHPDTEKYSCSSHKHHPVVGIERTAMDSDSRVAVYCTSRPSKKKVRGAC